MPEDKPFPLPPREMRAQLGIPEDIDEGTIQDLFYGKPAPPINMQEMFSPLQAGREALPTAIEAGALVGGGILAGGGGVPGMIAAGGLNVFGRHLANKMRALNEGQILPDRANPAAVSTDFILGAAQAMVPVAKGPLGFVQQGLTQAGIGQAENLMEGKPLSLQQAGESALMGAGMHGTFQGVGKLAGKVLPLRTEFHSENPIETNRRVPLTAMLSGERGSALMRNINPEPLPEQDLLALGFHPNRHIGMLIGAAHENQIPVYSTLEDAAKAHPEAKFHGTSPEYAAKALNGEPVVPLPGGGTPNVRVSNSKDALSRQHGEVTLILDPDKLTTTGPPKGSIEWSFNTTGVSSIPPEAIIGVALRDKLSNIGNRNYYRRKAGFAELKNLSGSTQSGIEGEGVEPAQSTPSTKQGTLKDMLSGEKGMALVGNLKPPTPDQMGFYSRLKHFADNLPDNAAHNPLALANQLQKGVTSKLELDETGVLPWLREQKGKVTSQQVRDYVDQHQIKVEEVQLGTPPNYEKELKRFNELSNKPSLTDAESEEFSKLAYKSALPTKYDRPETLTPFEHGAEPGSYRELVMTMPTERADFSNKLDKIEKEMYEKYGTEGVWSPEDQARHKAAYEKWFKHLDESRFISSHYSDIPNPLVHMRFDSRISPDGKKTLFLHEIQSDWHQKAHDLAVEAVEKTGLHKGDPGYSAAVTKMIPQMYQGYKDPTLPEKLSGLNQELNQLNEEMARRQSEDRYDVYEAAQRHNDILERIRNVEREMKGGTVPDAPLKQSTEWTALGLKRLLRYAAENGYDRIAWTPGEAQAERYDFSKYVSRIEYTNSGRLLVIDKGNNLVMNEVVPESEISKHIGKDVADKLLSQTPIHHSGLPSISATSKILYPEDFQMLTREGRGQVGYYGSPEKGSLGIVGGVMNDLGKKWGVKVSRTAVPAGNAYKTLSHDAVRRGVQLGHIKEEQVRTNLKDVHSLDLPDSLKQDVKEKGQPIASISDIFPMKERQA